MNHFKHPFHFPTFPPPFWITTAENLILEDPGFGADFGSSQGIQNPVKNRPPATLRSNRLAEEELLRQRIPVFRPDAYLCPRVYFDPLHWFIFSEPTLGEYETDSQLFQVFRRAPRRDDFLIIQEKGHRIFSDDEGFFPSASFLADFFDPKKFRTFFHREG